MTDSTHTSPTLYTVGHSTRTWSEFLALLQAHSITALADIRRFPGSMRLPQFGADSMAEDLSSAGIDYLPYKDLGGRRRPAPDSLNLGWHNPSFRAYADYMETADFLMALAHLLDVAEEHRTVIMCAEAVPWRCHRNLVADAAVLLFGWDVRHIMTEKKATLHKPAAFARVEGDHLIYPADDLIGNC